MERKKPEIRVIAKRPIIKVIDITELDTIYQRKDVAMVEKKQIEERCGNHEKRICGMEKKLTASLVGVISVLIVVIVELALTVIRSGAI